MGSSHVAVDQVQKLSLIHILDVYKRQGPDVVTYAEMMGLYAEVAGLARRRLVRVPMLTPVSYTHLDVYKRQRLPLPERGPGLGQDPMLFVEAQQVILWELGVKLNLVHCRDYTRLVNELL